MNPRSLSWVALLAAACQSSSPAVTSPTASPSTASEGGEARSTTAESPRSSPPESQETTQTTTALSADMRAVLDAHNAHRAAHCAPPLAWSPELAAVAQRYADQLQARGCDLAHSRGPYGENLFASSPPGSVQASGVEGAWYEERSQYRFTRPGFAMATGHFTQVVWRETTRLGCGVARCAQVEAWVCNYDPPGNVANRYRENVLPTTCR